MFSVKITSENMLNLFIPWPQASQESSLAYLLIYPKLVQWGEQATTFVKKELPPRQCPWIYDHSFPGNRDLLRKSEFKLLSLGPLRSKNRCTERFRDWSLEIDVQRGSGTGVWTPPCKLVVISSVVKLQEGIWGGPDTWLNYIVPWWGSGYSSKSPDFVEEHPIFQMPACPFI